MAGRISDACRSGEAAGLPAGMEDRKIARVAEDLPEIPESALVHVMPYIDDPKDRDAISLVCSQWYKIDARTRKHVTIALCYATRPERLRRRFKHLESLKLKGKPRASMFNLIPENWGGHIGPWAREIATGFDCLKALHFRRMIVTDEDLQILATYMGRVLQVFKLDKCSGFSSNGLIHVGRLCKNLRILSLEESTIAEKDGAWLHDLAINNTVLETLNFYMTELQKVSVKDLVLIAKNCPRLVSVKISDCEMMELVDFFRAATVLDEFGGGSFNEQPEIYNAISFPPMLCRIGLSFLGKDEIYILFPLAARLKKLDLLYALLDTDDHCLLIQQCPNLEVLETRNVIGDIGLEVLAQSCKRLKRLRIERGADEQGMEDEGGLVTQRGLIALAEGCLELEYLAVYVSDITNAALECVGSHLKNLYDFRLVLLDREEIITDLPLDVGVSCLLRGCEKLIRLALYLRPGGLTDVGLGYVGQYSPYVRWILLGYAGETDAGLRAFSRGCPSLQKLEMRGCCFSERALADAVMHLTSLRYLWVQGYRASENGRDILAMDRPFWNIELIPARRVIAQNDVGESVIHDDPAHILAYYSLVGPRTDCPDTVIPLYPTRLLPA